MADTTQPDPLEQVLAELVAKPQSAALNDAKTFLQSRTVWSALIGIGASFLQAHGHLISNADQASLVNDALTLVQYGGFVGAILFRVLATKTVA